MMIFLIALVPALGVLVVAAISKSRVKTTVAALIAAVVGVFTGNPAYTALDLLFVIIAYGISMSMVGEVQARNHPQLHPKRHPRSPRAIQI